MLSLGSILKSQYCILKYIGSGGFGNTYLAEDTNSNQCCVIKELKPVFSPKKYEQIRMRFEREAKILERLGKDSQGRIPRLYNFFIDNDYCYLAQEWIEGKTLRQTVEERGNLRDTQAKEILIALLQILDYVHSHRAIHRDIKPENIILRHQNNQPVLIDFGLVKEVINLDPDGNPTSSIMAGTIGYMPMEQMIGKPLYQSDIYSLGLTIVYLITGIDPKRDSVSENLVWRTNAPSVNSSFAECIEKAVEQKAENRYKNPQEMLKVLESIVL